MIFLDTGYLIALADPRDNLHRRALAWAARIRETGVLTDYVLLETVNFFSAVPDRPRAHALARAVRRSPGYRVIDASPGVFAAGLKLHSERPDKEWSLTDCISFQVMREWGLRQALAYDEHFEQAGFEALLRRDPAP
jgi:predicted nucleic acid-binding protein